MVNESLVEANHFQAKCTGIVVEWIKKEVNGEGPIDFLIGFFMLKIWKYTHSDGKMPHKKSKMAHRHPCCGKVTIATPSNEQKFVYFQDRLGKKILPPVGNPV